MEKYIGKYSVKDFLYLILGAFIYSIGTHSFIETGEYCAGRCGRRGTDVKPCDEPAGRTADTDGECAAFNTGVVSFEPVPLRCGRRLRAEFVRLCLTT